MPAAINSALPRRQRSSTTPKFSPPLWLGIALLAAMVGAVGADERPAKARRTPYDAFVYLNRMPEKPEANESASDLAGRIAGRLANQEGRILLKLPPGMDRKAYVGFKTFIRDEGTAQVGNCIACHTPVDFTDLKPHVVTRGGSPIATPSLRNLKLGAAELEKAILAKIAASRQLRAREANEIDAAYAGMAIDEKDVPGLVAFLGLLQDVPEADFRGLITNATVLDTSRDLEARTGVAGAIKLDGPKPKREPLQLNEESRRLHDTPPLDESFLVGDRGELANVFVYVKRGLEKKAYPVPTAAAVLNQDRSMFRPRVQGVQVGQELLMKNGDPLTHNLRSLSKKNRAFNIAQPAQSEDRKRVFTAGENAIEIKCDFHPWMKAYLFVMEHPYFAVTDEHGQFNIDGLRPGEYTLAAWHEQLGEQEQKITVDATGAAEVSFAFKPKAP